MQLRPAERGVTAAVVPRAPLLLAVIAASGCAQELPALTQLSEEHAALRSTQRGEILPLRPHWDAGGTLRWGGPQRSLGAIECAAGATLEAKIWRELPRFEEVRCYHAGGVLQGAWLASFDASGVLRWRVPLLLRAAVADRVAGVSDGKVGLESGRWVSDDGLVHSNLITGSQVRLLAPIAWSNDTLVKVTDGDDARSLERIALSVGDRAPLPPLPRAGWFSHWQIRDLAVSPDGRWLAAALESDWRGPAPVAVAVFDLVQNRWVALDARCPASLCQDPTVLVTNEKIGFAYRDLTTSQTNLVTHSLPK